LTKRARGVSRSSLGERVARHAVEHLLTPQH
jgi:hypothetical protein